MKKLLFIALLFLISCEKENDEIILVNQEGYVFQNDDIEITQCDINYYAYTNSQKFGLEITGKFTNPSANHAHFLVYYHNEIKIDTDVAPYAETAWPYRICLTTGTSDTLYRSSWHIYLTPDINRDKVYELTPTFIK
jgi:hypothetical protein